MSSTISNDQFSSQKSYPTSGQSYSGANGITGSEENGVSKQLYTTTNGTGISYDSVPESTGTLPSGQCAPTESHALATADHEEKGAVQVSAKQYNGPEAKDLGWNKPPEKVPTPLIGGLPNEELWTLIRRFNKQVYHVKATPMNPPGGLDLIVAKEDEFSPDKMRSNIERLYMTVIVGITSFAKHIARLRSWGEKKRTVAFCMVYFLAWALDFLMPLFFLTLLILVVYPPSRSLLFPPAPLALISASTGGIKNPTAGVLGSHGSLTGAPEKHEGEAVEQEAHSFVASFGSIALSSVAGKPHKSDGESKREDSVPDPSSIAMKTADARDRAASGDTSGEHNKTKQPVEEAAWEKARPVMHVIGDIADLWERLSNALSPTPPFHRSVSRIRIGGAILTPLFIISLFVNSYMVVKGTTFFFGAIFFGDPLIKRGLAWLDRNIPNWIQYIDIRNSILKGVPTNAQLTITLLRIGEASKAPLPPPPGASVSSGPAEHVAKPISYNDIPLDASKSEIDLAVHPDIGTAKSHTDSNKQHAGKTSMGKRLISFFKGTTKTGVHASLTTDKLKASVGSKSAQNRLGVLPTEPPPPAGPIEFPCRFHGKRGNLYIITSAASPCVAFSYEKREKPEFSVAVPEIKELKKVGGLGWKSKLVVGWSTDKNVIDGLEIVDRYDNKWLLTACPLRDELFNRLVAMDGQKWDSW